MELSNILELIHAVSDSNLTQFNLQDGNLNISMSAEKTIVQQVAANADAVAFAAQYQTAVQPVLQSVPQSAVLKIATAPVWASASMIRTPGMIGSCGKWPANCGSL